MRRREFIAALGSAAACPVTLFACPAHGRIDLRTGQLEHRLIPVEIFRSHRLSLYEVDKTEKRRSRSTLKGYRARNGGP
jgi:hypothetical protein